MNSSFTTNFIVYLKFWEGIWEDKEDNTQKDFFSAGNYDSLPGFKRCFYTINKVENVHKHNLQYPYQKMFKTWENE